MSDILNIIWIILLLEHQTPERAEELAKMFSERRWTHDDPVSYGEAKEMWLPVNDQMSEEIYQLMELYPQAKQQRLGVEFIPVPYRSPSAPGKGEK
jgi:ClpP class serine protease